MSNLILSSENFKLFDVTDETILLEYVGDTELLEQFNYYLYERYDSKLKDSLHPIYVIIDYKNTIVKFVSLVDEDDELFFEHDSLYIIKLFDKLTKDELKYINELKSKHIN